MTYVNTDDAGKLMRTPVAGRTVRNYIKSGRLPARRVGRDWYVDSNDARAFEQRPAGPPTRAEREARAKRDERRREMFAAREAKQQEALDHG